MEFEGYLYDRVLAAMEDWNEEGIYAISFFVYANYCFEYGGYNNVPEFLVSYNTEEDCGHAGRLSWERWQYLVLRYEAKWIIAPTEDDEGMQKLFQWYAQTGVENIGYEDEHAAFDEKMNYIGKGPNGYYELLCAAANVARRIQSEGIVARRFGSIPILVHALEYCWYVAEATAHANPNGEAADYLAWGKQIEEEAMQWVIPDPPS